MLVPMWLVDVSQVGCYNSAMIIDFHTHVLPPRIKKNRDKYVEMDPCFAMIYSDSRAKMATADELIEDMERDGVDVSVIANYGWTTHDLCVETNDYILESVARYPRRLVGFCSVQPNSYEAAVVELERCARAGAKGLGEMRPDMQLFDFNDDEVVAPLMEVIRKHRLILFTHTSEPVGHRYPGKGSITPDTFYPFIEGNPDIVMVCAHWGGGLPFYALMPEVNQSLRKVFFDTAASPLLYSPQIYGQVIQLVGADKILFGTDYPLLKQRRMLSEVSELDLAVESRDSILGGNAAQLLGLE